MSDSTIARRYARALYQEAEQSGRLERVDEDVQVVRDSLQDSRELQRMFSSAQISRERKQAVVEALFTGRVDELTVRMIHLLVSKGRESMLNAVIASYASLRDEQRGEVEAQVRVALPLSAEQEDQLKERLNAATGRSVRLEITEDPSLITGLVVRVGDTVYDGSARHKLKNLREQFAAKTFAAN